jgi:hypothetical protein
MLGNGEANEEVMDVATDPILSNSPSCLFVLICVFQHLRMRQRNLYVSVSFYIILFLDMLTDLLW